MPISAHSTAPKFLSDVELHERTKRLADREKATTLELLEYLHEVDQRRLYNIRGFCGLFSYCCEYLGYSESQSQERISAMRLMGRVPEIRQSLQRGKVTLSSISRLAGHTRRQNVNAEDTLSLLQKIEGKSTREAEKILLMETPSDLPTYEKIKRRTGSQTEIKILVDDSFLALLQRTKELRGNPVERISSIFRDTLTTYIDLMEQSHLGKKRRKESAEPSSNDQLAPLSAASPEKNLKSERNTSITQKGIASPSVGTPPVETLAECEPTRIKRSRYIPKVVRQQVIARSNYRCEYEDPLSKRRCKSRTGLQFDHITPWAMGGPSTATNIRHLCRAHNFSEAIRVLGIEKMRKYQSRTL